MCIGARITEPTLVKHDRVFYCEVLVLLLFIGVIVIVISF